MQQLPNSVTRTVATAVAVAAIALPVGWALAPASAQPATAAVATSAAPSTTVPPSGADRRAERRADRQERLAEQLGVTTDELQEARLAVLQDLVDERVDAGRITPERAEQIMEAARSGTLPELRRKLRAERASRR